MANIGSTNISFSGLKAAYVAGGRTDASGNSSLRDGQTNTSISLSFFTYDPSISSYKLCRAGEDCV